jgi:hypothetical protein
MVHSEKDNIAGRFVSAKAALNPGAIQSTPPSDPSFRNVCPHERESAVFGNRRNRFVSYSTESAYMWTISDACRRVRAIPRRP